MTTRPLRLSRCLPSLYLCLSRAQEQGRSNDLLGFALSNTKQLDFKLKSPVWWDFLQALFAIAQLWRDND